MSVHLFNKHYLESKYIYSRSKYYNQHNILSFFNKISNIILIMVIILWPVNKLIALILKYFYSNKILNIIKYFI